MATVRITEAELARERDPVLSAAPIGIS
jgi:hypothetical protein